MISGALTSIDDFYILSSGLVIQETSITNINSELWKYIRPENIVLQFIRNLVANRLAESGEEWSQIFEEHNSGTYNDQFMVVDYNHFKVGTQLKDLSDNLLWVIEQMPGIVSSGDVTGIQMIEQTINEILIKYFDLRCAPKTGVLGLI